MQMKEQNKLVRDNIPNIIKNRGDEPIIRILSDEEYWEALIQKDTEELIEVKGAVLKEERKKELADKLEVLKAMAEYNGFTLEEIIKEAKIKANKNGAFENKVFLESVIRKK